MQDSLSMNNYQIIVHCGEGDVGQLIGSIGHCCLTTVQVVIVALGPLV